MDLTLLFMGRINVAKTVRYLSISVIMLCPLFTLVYAILDLVTKAGWTQRRDSFCDCICDNDYIFVAQDDHVDMRAGWGLPG